jgi:hypothetical protein
VVSGQLYALTALLSRQSLLYPLDRGWVGSGTGLEDWELQVRFPTVSQHPQRPGRLWGPPSLRSTVKRPGNEAGHCCHLVVRFRRSGAVSLFPHTCWRRGAYTEGRFPTAVTAAVWVQSGPPSSGYPGLWSHSPPCRLTPEKPTFSRIATSIIPRSVPQWGITLHVIASRVSLAPITSHSLYWQIKQNHLCPERQ